MIARTNAVIATAVRLPILSIIRSAGPRFCDYKLRLNPNWPRTSLMLLSALSSPQKVMMEWHLQRHGAHVQFPGITAPLSVPASWEGLLDQPVTCSHISIICPETQHHSETNCPSPAPSQRGGSHSLLQHTYLPKVKPDCEDRPRILSTDLLPWGLIQEILYAWSEE